MVTCSTYTDPTSPLRAERPTAKSSVPSSSKPTNPATNLHFLNYPALHLHHCGHLLLPLAACHSLRSLGLGFLTHQPTNQQQQQQAFTMSWRCSASTNDGLISNLWRHGLLSTQRIADAMSKVDRAHFSREMPYQDSPQRIGYDATISAPHIHANALETLKDYIKPGSNVLDIGSGSGYLSAVMGHLVTPNGKVTGIDHIPQITNLSTKNLRKSPVHSSMLDSAIIEIITGDGRLGYPPNAPYDAIHVGAAAVDIHQALLDQLKAPGRMFIPMSEGGEGVQAVYQVDKDEKGNVNKKRLYGVMYVPLTDAKKYSDDGDDEVKS